MSATLHLKKLTHALQDLKAIPLWGKAPDFPWDNFSETLAQGLDKPDLKVAGHKTEWKEKEQILESMGEEPIIVPFALSPIDGTFFLALSQQARNILLQQFLNPEGKTPGLIDLSLQEGFYRFLCLNIIDLFNQQTPLGELTATLSDDQPLPEEGAFTTQLTIAINGKTLPGQIICPQEAHTHFKDYFKESPPPPLTSSTLSDLPLKLHLEVGSTSLKKAEWEKAEVGDFIFLERCTYDPKNNKGTAVLKMAHTPLFETRIKEGSVKILEYALINEDRHMTDDDKREEDLYEPENETEEPSAMWEPQEEETSHLPITDIPLDIHVEIARLQMPLAKVLELKPGNVLDLGLGKEPHVHLVVGGQRIAKGELVYLGEALGVKILNLSK